jgi:hypothetical protein
VPETIALDWATATPNLYGESLRSLTWFREPHTSSPKQTKIADLNCSLLESRDASLRSRIVIRANRAMLLRRVASDVKLSGLSENGES